MAETGKGNLVSVGVPTRQVWGPAPHTNRRDTNPVRLGLLELSPGRLRCDQRSLPRPPPSWRGAKEVPSAYWNGCERGPRLGLLAPSRRGFGLVPWGLSHIDSSPPGSLPGLAKGSHPHSKTCKSLLAGIDSGASRPSFTLGHRAAVRPVSVSNGLSRSRHYTSSADPDQEASTQKGRSLCDQPSLA